MKLIAYADDVVVVIVAKNIDQNNQLFNTALRKLMNGRSKSAIGGKQTDNSTWIQRLPLPVQP